jgi:hypothetical protein
LTFDVRIPYRRVDTDVDRIRKREFLVHWNGHLDVEDSWVKEVDIDPEMVKAYLDRLEAEKANTTSSPKLRRGSAST